MATTKKKSASHGRTAKSKSGFKSGRCWPGYEPVPGKKAYSKGSCRKK
jgi:hypothetical protein